MVVAKRETKYIFVTGGVLSGLGKGITAASLGTILKARGFLINIQKLDPYLNFDAGTLNPSEHGEVFVTADGAETDLDLGHYERFIDRELNTTSSIMNGRIYAKVIADERAGKYLGKTVQIIPHVIAEIQNAVLAAGKGHDIQIVELGGTVRDYESLATIEAIRQFKHRVGFENVLYVHLVYLPYLSASKELKTKPAQNAVRDLREAGIHPDVIIARSDIPFNGDIVAKLSLFSDVDPRGIVPMPNADSVYEVPLILEKADIGNYITDKLGLGRHKPNLKEWESLLEVVKRKDRPRIKIGVVAKYMGMEDTYMSVFEAIKAAAWANNVWAEIGWVDAEKLESEDGVSLLKGYDGIIVPGGFGSRGVEGKVMAAGYAIDHELPYLGLCLGMQVGVIALARRALGTKEANTMEIDPQVKHPVISLMADQTEVVNKGGTMRLGNYPCILEKQSISYRAYGSKKIVERHRHRFEFNNAYRGELVKAGLVLAGVSPDGHLVEIIEIKNHPFFVASQFHPEFKSRPNRPHPLFDAFIKAAAQKAKAQPTIGNQKQIGYSKA